MNAVVHILSAVICLWLVLALLAAKKRQVLWRQLFFAHGPKRVVVESPVLFIGRVARLLHIPLAVADGVDSTQLAKIDPASLGSFLHACPVAALTIKKTGDAVVLEMATRQAAFLAEDQDWPVRLARAVGLKVQFHVHS